MGKKINRKIFRNVVCQRRDALLNRWSKTKSRDSS